MEIGDVILLSRTTIFEAITQIIFGKVRMIKNHVERISCCRIITAPPSGVAAQQSEDKHGRCNMTSLRAAHLISSKVATGIEAAPNVLTILTTNHNHYY